MTKVARNLTIRISISLLVLTVVGLSSLTARAVTCPFHLVEHGTLTVDTDGNLVADGAGTVTHIGRFTLHREATLKPSDDGSGLVDLVGRATLTAADGAKFDANDTAGSDVVMMDDFIYGEPQALP